MERTGILHVEPNAKLLPTPEDPIKRSLGLSEGIYNLFGKHYENKLNQQKAEKGERTMEGEITATNAKNNADTIYYPQLQKAELGIKQETIKEVMSKTGLNYAQAKVAMAHLPLLAAQTAKENRSERGEGGKQAQLYAAYKNAPPGSDAQKYYYALLRKEMGGYAPEGGGAVPNSPSGGGVPSSYGSSQATSGIDANTGIPFSLEKNQMGSKRGAGQYNVPQIGVTGEAPTQASMSRNQTRTEATAEIDAIENTLKGGYQPYMGAGGTLKLAYDSYLARTEPNTKKGKEAAEKLLKYNTSEKLKREAANIISRQSAGQAPGVEAAREQEEASFGGGPYKIGNYFTPPEILRKSQDEYFVKQKELANAAVNQERLNYPVKNESNPMWAQGESGGGTGFGSSGYLNPEKQQVAQGFRGNPNVIPESVQQKQTPAQNRAEQNIYDKEVNARAQNEAPREFESKEAAQSYFNSLSPEEKKRYLASLPE